MGCSSCGRYYCGTSANEVWTQAASDLHPSGDWLDQSSRAGRTRELLHVTFRIGNPRQRWVYSREPALNPAAYLAEVMWILAGRQDADPINFFIPPYPRFAGTGPVYHGAYGHRLRKHFQVDQLERAYYALQSNRNSRQVVLQIWSPEDDLPLKNGLPQDQDIPCNISCLLKVRDGRLEWTQIIRSNDIHKGLPVNVVQFTTLQEVLAGWLDVDLGEYCQWSDSLHLYEEDKDFYNSIDLIEPPAFTPSSFALDRTRSSRAIDLINSHIDWLVQNSPTRDRVKSRLRSLDLPAGFRDAAYVMTADATYRHYGYPRLAQEISQNCADQRLRFLWDRWENRLENP